jgi:hypothetical protein
LHLQNMVINNAMEKYKVEKKVKGTAKGWRGHGRLRRCPECGEPLRRLKDIYQATCMNKDCKRYRIVIYDYISNFDLSTRYNSPPLPVSERKRTKKQRGKRHSA